MTVVRNVFSDWKTSVCSSASVDSALAGNHDDASLFSSSVILDPKPNPSTIVTTTQNARTAHLTLRPQTAPAILLVMAILKQSLDAISNSIAVNADTCRVHANSPMCGVVWPGRFPAVSWRFRCRWSDLLEAKPGAGAASPEASSADGRPLTSAATNRCRWRTRSSL